MFTSSLLAPGARLVGLVKKENHCGSCIWKWQLVMMCLEAKRLGKNRERGMLGHPSVHCWLLCFFYVMVQCFIPTFDVFRVGDFGTFFPNFHFIVWFQMRGRFVVTVVFFRKWFCLGAFSTQHQLCSLRLLASNVGRPGYSEFVQLVLKRAAQEQIKNRRHATGSALLFGSKVALIMFQIQTVPWGVVKFHCVSSHAFL